MLKFIKNITLFLLPLLLIPILSAPFYFSAKETGELDNIEKSAAVQRTDHNCLIGLGYNEQTPYYKLLNANYYKAPIISLGTSRVMQFRQDFFSTEFYNCGGAVFGNYNEYRNFLENLNYKPETVIIGLDSWVFNDAWNTNCIEFDSYREIQTDDYGIIQLMYSIIKDRFSGRWTAKDLHNYPENIGFNGRVKDNGFMYDGSYYYGELYRDPTDSYDYNFEYGKSRIANGVRRFEWGQHIDEDTLNQLDNLLSYCKDNNIDAVGFLPPFAPCIYDLMKKSGSYNYLYEISPACTELFSKYNYEFYDYTDGEELGMKDHNFIDSHHGSDIVYLQILISMTRNGSMITRYADQEKLESLMENAYNEYTYANPFTRKST